VATTLAAAAPAMSQVGGSPSGDAAESPGRRRGGGLVVKLRQLLTTQTMAATAWEHKEQSHLVQPLCHPGCNVMTV